MAETSTIEWTDATWTPIRARRFVGDTEPGWPERGGWHCEHASPGCVNCYAESINLRLGTGVEFKPANLKHKTPLGDDRGDVEVFLDEGMLVRPLRWRRPRQIFVCSMTDLFAGFVRDEWIDAVFGVMALAQHHTFQVLTKRADRLHKYLTERAAGGRFVWDAAQRLNEHLPRGQIAREPDWPLPNVHIGVSVEDQRRSDERLDLLKATPAARRFVSFEPLLEHVTADLRGIDLAIIGGESGQRARWCSTAWVESLIGQARAGGCAPFVKQLGARVMVPPEVPGGAQTRLVLKSAKGGDMAEWPERLRVREVA